MFVENKRKDFVKKNNLTQQFRVRKYIYSNEKISEGEISNLKNESEKDVNKELLMSKENETYVVQQIEENEDKKNENLDNITRENTIYNKNNLENCSFIDDTDKFRIEILKSKIIKETNLYFKNGVFHKKTESPFKHKYYNSIIDFWIDAFRFFWKNEDETCKKNRKVSFGYVMPRYI
ncbi:hypothetical protein GVAV_001315 [Gurleya vavrai]